MWDKEMMIELMSNVNIVIERLQNFRRVSCIEESFGHSDFHQITFHGTVELVLLLVSFHLPCEVTVNFIPFPLKGPYFRM